MQTEVKLEVWVFPNEEYSSKSQQSFASL